ncbi:MAG TPA: DUF6326 family protein [Candidatus Bathyarchaeia archaeon]|nr:DUF6326 family protein [Candidatus Bathyarchaeia archaeon]
MNSEKKTATILEDPKINIKTKLAALWVILMFFYIYNDVFSLFQPGNIEKIIAGEIEMNQAFLLGAAILMAIPSLMVFLSLTLKAKANRWANIIAGIFYAGVLLTTMLVPGELWAYYALYMIIEGVLIALVIWYAWKWPKQEEGKAVAT